MESLGVVYQCPLCKIQMERDLVKFLDHTNQHIIDSIQKKHPEWQTQDGICKPCVDYYRGQLSGEIQNIGPAGRGARVVLGIISLGISIAAGIYMLNNGAPALVRAGLFIPLFMSAFGFIQAQQKTCSVLAELGSVEAVKTKGRKILFCSFLAAAVLTALYLLIPSQAL